MSVSKDISELFNHIVQSEEKIKQRFEALKQANNAIQSAQEDLRNTRYETNIVNGKISTLNHKLLQEKIQKTWLESCEDILKEQYNDCSVDIATMRDEVEAKRKNFEGNRIAFLNEVDSYVRQQWDKCFGAEADEQHEEYCEEEYEKLLSRQQQLRQKINQREEDRVRKETLEAELKSLQEGIDGTMKECQELKSELEREEDELRHLNARKMSLSKKISTDEEFQNVLRELEHCKKQCNLASDHHQHLTKQLCMLQKQVQKSRGNAWYVGGGGARSYTSGEGNSSRAAGGFSRSSSVGSFGGHSTSTENTGNNRRGGGRKMFPYKKVERTVVDEYSSMEKLPDEDIDMGDDMLDDIDPDDI